MAYEPTVWANGDTITAEKLNNAEEGIAGAYSLVTATLDTTTYTTVLDKKYGEIEQIMASGIVPVLKNVVEGEEDAYYIVIKAGYDSNTQKYFIGDSNSASYYAVDKDKYPATAGLG